MNKKDVIQNIFELFEEVNLTVNVSKLTFKDKMWTHVEVSSGSQMASAIDCNFDEAFYCALSKLYASDSQHKTIYKKVEELKSQLGCCGGCAGSKEESNLFEEEDNNYFRNIKSLRCDGCSEFVDECICVDDSFKDDEPVELTIKKDPPKSKKKNKKTTEKLIEEFNKQVTKIETAKSKK
jgi:hypothetical protein